MKVVVSGELNKIDGRHLPNSFNYQNYFYHNLFIYDIKANKIDIISKEFSIYYLSNLVRNYLNYFFTDESLIILEGFILGDTSNFSNSFKNSLKINGIVHLFAVSGLHVSIIINILDKIFTKSKKKSKIINTILIIYLFITSFMVSIMRSIFTYLLKSYLENKNIKLTSLDITSIIFIIFILFNPFYIYNLGFILSFFATFIILLLSDSIKNFNKIKSLIFITVVINLFTLPILVNTNNNFNLITPIINLIMVFLVESIILPLSFLVFFLPIFNNMFGYVVISFIKLSESLSKISKIFNFVVTIGSMSSCLILIFYLIIYIFLVTYKKNIKLNKVSRYLFVILLIFINFQGSVKLTPTITFFDVSVGDAILIEKGSSKVLIDTGIGRGNELTLTLNSLGIKKLDYLVLTHNHKDHNGEAEIILEELIVKKVVVSIFDDSKFSKRNNSIRLKTGDKIELNGLNFKCLSPNKNSSNVNNNSLVLFLKVYNTTLLFMGDAEKEVEEEINISNIDILKVGHHGSNTSTTSLFLNKINPKVAVITSGRSNSFEFPSLEVLDRLKNYHIKTYITKYDYTIKLVIRRNKFNFYTMNKS